MKIYDLYPEANAIYDCGEYYGVNVQESFYLVNKKTLKTEKTLLRYDSQVIELIEKAVPIHYSEDED